MTNEAGFSFPDAFTAAGRQELIEGMLGLFTVPALALGQAIAHPLSVERGTVVVHADLNEEDEEFSLVQLAMAADADVLCVLGGDDADGTSTLLAVQAGERDAWIGYCRAFCASPTAQMVLLPLDPSTDLHLVTNIEGRLEQRAGRPATHAAFGHRIAAARIGRAAHSIRAGFAAETLAA